MLYFTLFKILKQIISNPWNHFQVLIVLMKDFKIVGRDGKRGIVSDRSEQCAG